MARGIPIPYEQLPRTATNLGGFQKSAGIEGLNTNNSASIQAAGNVAQVDPRGFVVAEQQVGNIGKAIAGEGQAIMAIRLKQNEAINIRKEYEANTSMEMAQAQINSDLELEPDETKWAGIAEKHSTALRESLLKQDLSPDARDAIAMKMDSWQRRASLAVTINSAKRSNDKVKDAGAARRLMMTNRGDYTGALNNAETEHAAGFMSAVELENERERLRKLAEKANVDRLLGIANNKPEEFTRDFAKLTEGLDEVTKDSLMTQADQALRSKISKQTEDFSDKIAQGDFKTMDDLNTGFPPEMKETTKLEFRYMWGRMNNAEHKAKLLVAVPENFARFKDAVSSYDPSTDPGGERYVKIKMGIVETLPTELRADLITPLDRKFGPSWDLQVPEGLSDAMYNITRNMFNAEAFGKFKRLEFRKDSTGAIRKDWEMKEVEDEKAKNIAYAKRGEAEIYMKDWMAKFPNAGVFKALDELNQFLSGKTKPVRARVSPYAPMQRPIDTPVGSDPTLGTYYRPNNQVMKDNLGFLIGEIDQNQPSALFPIGGGATLVDEPAPKPEPDAPFNGLPPPKGL
jgi:hypothetical protein